MTKEVAGEIDSAFPPNANPQEQRQQFGVGKGAGSEGKKALPRAFVGRPVGRWA